MSPADRPLGRGASPVERARDEHPGDESWRADALARSRHSRLLDELLAPGEDHDPGRATEVCGEITRNFLLDFAPALMLLPDADRRRAQALAAYALTLFDFARQSGLEGERLSQINRWEFNLDLALEGKPPGQPVFVLVADQQTRRAWPVRAFDLLAEAARGRVAAPRPRTAQAAEAAARRIAEGLLVGLAGDEVPPEAVTLTAALVRLHGLLTLGEGLRRHQATLPLDELPERWEAEEGVAGRDLEPAVERECRRVRGMLADGKPGLEALPRRLRPAARFFYLTATRLLSDVERLGAGVADAPPRLGLTARLGLLLRARWLGVG